MSEISNLLQFAIDTDLDLTLLVVQVRDLVDQAYPPY
jgi:hypothetical protein